MKDWAIENGATHYTHWFQPMTGLTAEKHDAFSFAGRRWAGDKRIFGKDADFPASPMRRHSPLAASALLLRRAAIQPGIPTAPAFLIDGPCGATPAYSHIFLFLFGRGA